jgi:hypothetical protein
MTSIIRLWPAAGAAALTLLAAGCGPSSSGGGGPDSSASAPAPAPQVATYPKACDVLTEAIAKKYLGPAAALRRDVQTNSRASQCQYGDENGLITVEVGQWEAVNVPMTTDKSVPGLGDESHVGPGGVYVRKGDVGLNVDVMVGSGEFWGSAADDMEAQTEAAAKKVAPDLVAKL